MRHLIYKHSYPLLMAAILLAVIVNGQSGKPRYQKLDGEYKFLPVESKLIPLDTPKNQYAGKHFNITDDAGKVLATRNPSGVWTIKDAQFSLEVLYQGYEDLMIKCNEMVEMFSYIRENGTVSDRKKLAKAIQNFLNKYSK